MIGHGDDPAWAPLTTASAWEWHHHNSPYDIVAYRFGPASSDAAGEWVKTETLDRLQQEIADLRAALSAVRTLAIPAGAALWLQRESWDARCTEVLDIIDGALQK